MLDPKPLSLDEYLRQVERLLWWADHYTQGRLYSQAEKIMEELDEWEKRDPRRTNP